MRNAAPHTFRPHTVNPCASMHHSSSPHAAFRAGSPRSYTLYPAPTSECALSQQRVHATPWGTASSVTGFREATAVRGPRDRIPVIPGIRWVSAPPPTRSWSSTARCTPSASPWRRSPSWVHSYTLHHYLWLLNLTTYTLSQRIRAPRRLFLQPPIILRTRKSRAGGKCLDIGAADSVIETWIIAGSDFLQCILCDNCMFYE